MRLLCPIKSLDSTSTYTKSFTPSIEDSKQRDSIHQWDSLFSNLIFKAVFLTISAITLTIFLYWLLGRKPFRDEEASFANSLLRFANSLLSHWVSLMSACVSLAIGMIRGKGRGNKVFLALAAIFLFVACFLAWRDEHKLQAQPHQNLICQIEKIVVGRGPDSNETQVFVLLSVRNAGEPSIAEKYELRIKSNSLDVHIKTTNIPKNYTLSPVDNMPKVTFSLQDSLEERTARPISTGSLERGWLRFVIPDMQVKEMPSYISRPGTIYTVSLSDVSGAVYSADYVEPVEMQ